MMCKLSRHAVIACVLLSLLLSRVHAAQPLALPLEVVHPMSLVSHPAQSAHLYASTDRTHRNRDYILIPPKTTVTALTLPGPGWIVRIWLTSDHPESITATLRPKGCQRSVVLCNRGKGVYVPHPMWAGMVGEAYFCYRPVRCSPPTT